VDHAAQIDLLRSMVGIPSASGAETRLARWLVQRLTALGFAARRDEVGNVIADCGPAGGPRIMLLGHIDTVPGTPPVRVVDDVLYGRGTVDAKGPLATMICAAEAVARVGLPVRIRVVGAVDEERTSIGARHLARGRAPAALVIGEPSGAGHVGIGYKGMFRFRMSATQPAAHTSSPAPSAADLIADFWPLVRGWLARGNCAPEPPAEQRLFDRSMPTIVGIGGDTERAWIEVSCRVPLDFDAAEFRAALARLAEGGQIDVLEDVPAVRARPDDPVVRALGGAIRASGALPVHRLKLGTADWNVVAASWQVPTAAYGPGDSRLCHAEDEHLSISEYLTAIGILTDALGRLAVTVRPGPVAGCPAGSPLLSGSRGR
jgi:LysW-gamma-L-lysine carboxypeptidase